MKRLAIVASMAVCAVVGLYVGDEYWPALFASPVPKADAIVVNKSSRTLTLITAGAETRTYSVALGSEPSGHKRQEGDGRTPEGKYAIEWRKPNSRFYRALRISYPNQDDRKAAERLGTDPGGDIMIHGVPRGLGLVGRFMNKTDWTNGCVAVDDVSMAEIWSAVEVGTPIEVRP